MDKMNIRFFSIVFSSTLMFLLISTSIMAQGHRHQHHRFREKIEQYKIAYITEKLDLTPEEAQKFWPVYNKYNNMEDSLHVCEHRMMFKDILDVESMSDDEIKEYVDGRIIHMQRMLELKKAYHQELKNVLPLRKVAELYIAEKNFKRFLLKKLKGFGPHQGRR